MKESTAWRILAKEYDAGRTGSSVYLCPVLKHPERTMSAVTKIPLSVRQSMLARIEEDLGVDAGGAYDYDTKISDEEERGSRVLACLIFSREAADGEKGPLPNRTQQEAYDEDER